MTACCESDTPLIFLWCDSSCPVRPAQALRGWVLRISGVREAIPRTGVLHGGIPRAFPVRGAVLRAGTPGGAPVHRVAPECDAVRGAGTRFRARHRAFGAQRDRRVRGLLPFVRARVRGIPRCGGLPRRLFQPQKDFVRLVAFERADAWVAVRFCVLQRVASLWEAAQLAGLPAHFPVVRIRAARPHGWRAPGQGQTTGVVRGPDHHGGHGV